MSFLQDLGSFLGDAQSLRDEIVQEFKADANEVKQTVTDTTNELKGAAVEVQDTIVQSTSLPSDPFADSTPSDKN